MRRVWVSLSIPNHRDFTEFDSNAFASRIMSLRRNFFALDSNIID
ncbi:hypothetical protein V5H82_02470 [Helicobacter pylori]